MPDFDYIVIGSGPAAVAALNRMPMTGRVCVVTGENAIPAEDSRAIHPKIRSVSMARREAAGIAGLAAIDGRPKSFLFETAIVGGLANYWGQQFVRYRAPEPWPSDVFSNYLDYTSECALIESLFVITGGDTCVEGQDGLTLEAPRLLVGAAVEPRANLFSMRQAFDKLAAARNVVLKKARVMRWCKVFDGWRVDFDAGHSLSTRRIVVAAGGVATARLVLASHPQLAGARFLDHTPWLIYTIGAGGWAASVGDKASSHFNVATIRQDGADGCHFFASLYNMGRADLNLILGSVVGVMPRLLDGVPAPWGSSMVRPVQAWTRRTVGEIEIGTSGAIARVEAGSCPNDDVDLVALTTGLKARGARVLHCSATAAGSGFHYHALRIIDGEGRLQAIDDFLDAETAGEIVCVDASVLKQIGVPPPTLTAMAVASRVASTLD